MLVLSLLAAACGQLELKDPVILSVSPTQFDVGATQEIQVLGDNFFASADVDLDSRKDIALNTAFQVHLGDLRGQGLRPFGVHKLTFMAPAGLVPGWHALTLETPYGKRAVLEHAVNVVGPALPGSGGGGGTGGRPNLAGGTGGTANIGGTTSTTGGTTNASGGATNTIGGAGGSTSGLMGCVQQTYGPSSFLFCRSQLVNWDEARALCQSLNMDLPRIDSAAENNFVMMGMQTAGLDFIWLGANDRAAEGSWVWPNGDPLWTGDAAGMPVASAYTNWGVGQPDNSQLAMGEDCAVLQEQVTVAFWSDYGCKRRFQSVVCEATP